MTIPCFWAEPTGEQHYSRSVFFTCGHRWESETTEEQPSFDDMRLWPAVCGECGKSADYGFGESADTRSYATKKMYRRVDTGEERYISDFGPGLMYDAHWYTYLAERSVDGRAIAVRLLGNHDWVIDGEASNCTRKGEPHDCWCRHGEPPMLTVDKNPEPGRSTCQAGGGSIWVNEGRPLEWHGFLTRGHLVMVGEQPPP